MQPDEWYTMPVHTGRLIRLEPLTAEHSDGYLAAAGTGEDAADVFRWLTEWAPQTVEDAAAHIARALAGRAQGTRFAYAQFDVRTGEFAGSTSLYDVSPAARTLAIGFTWLGRPWWRSGHNTESKLLLLGYAFDTLGCVRVAWHTDIYNERSQAAIARLGATREGVLRKHRLRKDGTWRDTVQYSMTDDDWPAARDKLAARLAAG